MDKERGGHTWHNTRHIMDAFASLYSVLPYVARTAVGANIYGWVCARYFLARPWAALRLRSSLQLYLHLFILASPELHTHIPGAHLDDPQAQPKQRLCDPKVVALGAALRLRYSLASIKRLPLGIIRNRHRKAMPTTPTYRVERRLFLKNCRDVTPENVDRSKSL